ncbi:zinc finger BED domain-containing protein 1-like [Poecilia reticulata]|uniref:zinc finger BED domain-containing protein 1-like n=1 Tax=Poecilia reticulata TaxID=8081 RepID=UPI0004A45845|nr:PREDICTED: zinc finger BED domain-containing protein 1-like [Poecilia reticulata]
MKRTVRRRSSAWSYFEQVGANFVRCKKCDAELKYCGGATSTMISHMAAKHHVSIPLRSAARGSWGETPPSWRAPDTEEESAFNPEREPSERRRNKRSSVWDVFVKVDEEVHCKLCDTKLKYMSSTTSMMYHIKNKHTENPQNNSVAMPTQAQVTKLVTNMIEKDMFPISVVDGDGFRELLADIVHSYNVPSADEITRSIECHYHEKAADLRMRLAAVEKVALTADIWTAMPSQKYITVSCSFITEDWQGKSAVLHTHKLPSGGQLTAECVAEKLFSTTQSWMIAGKVPACVHNNKENIQLTQGVAQVTWNYVSCFATTLHLAVSDGLSEDVLQIISAAGRLVRHFSHSSLAAEALKEKQAQMCLPQHKLIRSNRARWDTVCDMFQCLLEQRWAIKAVLSDRTVTSKHEAQTLEIGDDCWQVIENFTPVLATLKWATTVISAETEVSISNIYPITFSLIQTHLVPKENDVEQVSSFKLAVQKSLRDHMEVDSSDLASNPALIASMLDPRHKHLNFLMPAGRLAAKVKLHELVSKLDASAASPKDEQLETEVTPDLSQTATARKPPSDTKNTMMLLLGDNYSSSYATDSEAQVDYYLRDIAPSLDINPLDWWRLNGPRFPKLASLAREYLCIPGVSLPSLLSDAGQSFAAMRTRLNPEHVNMMVFLNRNASI